MRNKISISELMSTLDPHTLTDIQPAVADDAPVPDHARIHALVTEKLGVQRTQNVKKRYGMKNRKLFVIIAAATLCLLSVTALAAGLGGLDFFRSIFGGSAEDVKGYIADPRMSAESDTTILTVESLLTDGYQINVIASIAGKDGKDPGAEQWDITLASDSKKFESYITTELLEFKENGQRYYSIIAKNETGIKDASLTVACGDLSVTVQPGESLGTISVTPDAAQYESVNYTPTSVRISPMGILVIGTEKEQRGGIPAPEVELLYKNGNTENVLDADFFDQNSDELTLGGGGAILSGDGSRLLVEEFMGERNPAKELVISAPFTRILDLSEVQAIIMDGIRYDV